MLIKANGDQIVEFPYDITKLYEENPNTSFPRQLNDSLLASYGIYRVNHTTVEGVNHNTHKVVAEETPEYVDGEWVLGATVVELSEEEKNIVDMAQQEAVLARREALLSETDWWAVSDRTMTAEQTAYRQALRDITSHENFPDLNEEDWPIKP